MLRRIRYNALWFALFGALLCGFGFAVWQASTVPQLPRHTAEASTTKSQENEIKEREISATETIAHWTVILGVFTALLFGTSLGGLYFIGRADRTARISADAATTAATASKKSADSAFEAERARFYVVISGHTLKWLTDYVEQSFRPPRGDESPVDFQVSYKFRNYGKTPGVITELAIGCKVAEEPVDPVFTLKLNEFSEWMIGAGDTTSDQKFSYQMTFADGREIRRNRKRLWLYGRLYYDDAFGNHREHRFYFRSVREGDSCLLQPYRYKNHHQNN